VLRARNNWPRSKTMKNPIVLYVAIALISTATAMVLMMLAIFVLVVVSAGQ
jgi:hypothetical protein